MKLIKLLLGKIQDYYDKIPNEKWKLSFQSALPFWIGAFLVGIVAVFYAQLFEWAEHSFFWLLEKLGWWMFLVSPVLFVASFYVVLKGAPFASGSGIPQVSASLELISKTKSNAVIKLLSFPIVFIKIISSFLMALGGGVIGREGPTIQIAASIFKKIYDLLPEGWPRISPKNMIMTGAASGLAAAFNTPLGGLVFAIEELTKTHFNTFKNSIFIGVVIAGITAQSFVGSYLYLGYPLAVNIDYSMVFAVILASAFTGWFAGLYSRWVMKLSRWRKSLNRTNTILYLIGIALFITAMALFLDHRIAGPGREIIVTSLFSSDKYLEWFVPIGKWIGSAFCFSSGSAGGVFAPSLSIGASISAAISGLLHLTPDNTNLLIMTGMVAFLTGITRSPFTSAILVLEMTDRHNLIFFFMLAALFGQIAAKAVCRKSLYESIKEGILSEFHKE